MLKLVSSTKMPILLHANNHLLANGSILLKLAFSIYSLLLRCLIFSVTGSSMLSPFSYVAITNLFPKYLMFVTIRPPISFGVKYCMISRCSETKYNPLRVPVTLSFP